MRLAIVDIETTGFHAESAHLLLARIKPLGGPSRLLGLHNIGFSEGDRPDSKLSLAIREEMETYDGWITWNGLKFDLPFIDDCLMLNGHDPLERRFARGLDMMFHASWFKGTFERRSLEHVALSFGWKGLRAPLSETICKRAEVEALKRFKGGRRFYNAILKHNVGCIAMTQFCYGKLKPRIVTISKR